MLKIEFHDHRQSQGFSKAGGENPFSASQDDQLISTANFKKVLQHKGDFPLTANAQELPDNPAAAFQGLRSQNISETFIQTSRSLHTRVGQETHVRAHPKSTSVPISSSYHITSDAQNGSALSAIKIRCCGFYDTSRIHSPPSCRRYVRAKVHEVRAKVHFSFFTRYRIISKFI